MTTSQDDMLARAAPRVWLRWEGVWICLLAWLAFAAIPLSLGHLGLAWDTLNHHIYLGWSAERHRFDRDFVAAGFQAMTYPYMYWPAYKMASLNWSGTAAGFVLATLHAGTVWPVWRIAKACLPGTTRFDAAMRFAAVLLALLSAVILSAMTTTITDVLSSAPLVWAIAVGLMPVSAPQTMRRSAAYRLILLSGLLAGVAVGAKLSNGVLAICMPLLWVMAGSGVRERVGLCLLGSIGAVCGAVLVFGPWGWILWEHFGNPVYPFFDHWFAPMQPAVGQGG